MYLTLFPEGYCIFQDDNARKHTAHIVQNWFQEHETELRYMEWLPQPPDLNIIEYLWCILEWQVRSRYPPPSRVQVLELKMMISKNVYDTLWFTKKRKCESRRARPGRSVRSGAMTHGRIGMWFLTKFQSIGSRIIQRYSVWIFVLLNFYTNTHDIIIRSTWLHILKWFKWF